jgi:hypothetical protein
MSAISGSMYGVFSGATNKLFSCRTSSLKVDVNLDDVTTKDSGGWAAHINGLRSWSIDFEGVYDETDAGATSMTPIEILAAIIARTADAECAFKPDATTTGTGWKGNATFKNITLTGDMETGIKFSGSLVGNAPLVAIAKT